MKRALVLASVYFAIFFTVGFVLGAIRVTLLLPELGQRYSELVEMPVILLALFVTARWLVTRFDLIGKLAVSLFTGLIAASMLLAIEFSVVL